MIKDEIKRFFKGEYLDDWETRRKYSHDASLLEVIPEAVLFPKDVEDIKNLVKFVSAEKKINPNISITARSAGTCMSGGSINESLIIDFVKYFHGTKWVENSIEALPGTYYKDLEKVTLEKGLILPCYTASKNICAIGGMVGNNSGGEKTLNYGKTENFIEELEVIFADGNLYKISPLNQKELDKKLLLQDFEGEIYRNIFSLIKENYTEIMDAKPKVSKNSAGYYLWNVWDKKIFDLSKLIVGSQGTLGIVTKIKLRLVKVKTKKKLVTIFLKDIDSLGEIVNEAIKLKPDSIESYDDHTLKLALRFFPELISSMKAKNFFRLFLSFVPEAISFFFLGFPKLVILVEFSGENDKAITDNINLLKQGLEKYKLRIKTARSEEEAEKYWAIRRESFNLLRKHVRGKRTAPFIDDIIILPKDLPEFLPKLQKILKDYNLVYTTAGHVGNGNFHIIPLMDMHNLKNLDIILEISERVFDLVIEYGGSITAEHNDGIIRTPYLHKMYSQHIIDLFRETKNIFDPNNIFNPGKKVGGSLDYLKTHIIRET